MDDLDHCCHCSLGTSLLQPLDHYPTIVCLYKYCISFYTITVWQCKTCFVLFIIIIAVELSSNGYYRTFLKFWNPETSLDYRSSYIFIFICVCMKGATKMREWILTLMRSIAPVTPFPLLTLCLSVCVCVCVFWATRD